MEVLSEEYGTLTFEWTPVGKRFFSKKNPLKNQYNANTKFVSIWSQPTYLKRAHSVDYPAMAICYPDMNVE